jgi:hypothetical protein
MKTQILKLSLLVAVVLGVAFALRSQPSTPAPAKSYDTYGNDGRYRLIVADSTQYVIDTQTGRVWHSVVDMDNRMMVLVSYTYQNIDGEKSTIPNETATGVFVKHKAPGTSDPQDKK